MLSVKDIDFDLSIFTNLSSEHLDYHKTFKEYLLAKKQFFDALSKDSICLANKDSLYFSTFWYALRHKRDTRDSTL